MTILTPCAALPNTGTGIDGWIALAVGAVAVAGGVTAMFFAKSLKAKLTALALPLVAGAAIVTGTAQPSYAATGAPTVTTEAVLSSTTPGSPTDPYVLTLGTEPVFNNPENCGTMTYQWEVKKGLVSTSLEPATVITPAAPPLAPTTGFVNFGAPTSAFAPYSHVGCFETNLWARIKVTLKNNSGSATSTSVAVPVCAAG